MKESLLVLIILALFVTEARPASSERITKERQCHQVAVWALDIFNQVKQSPKVILSGMDANDESAFTYIRQWVKEGKSRDELYQHTFNLCMGTEV